MGWLDRLRGKTAAPVPAGALTHTLPLGFRVNGRVALDTMFSRAHPEALTAPLPEGHQGIPCYGHIDLGGGHALHRFYLDDDAYVQVSTNNDAVEGIKAFVFVETVLRLLPLRWTNRKCWPSPCKTGPQYVPGCRGCVPPALARTQ